MDLFKSPGIAESLDWAEALIALDRVALDPADGRRHAGRAAQVSGRHRRARTRSGGEARRRSPGRGHPVVTFACGRLSAAASPLPRGRLAENVLHFVRVLRNTGLPLGPAKVLDALSAVQAVGVDNRTDFRAALASVLVSRREQLPLFDQAFELFWRDPKLLEKMLASLLPKVHARSGDREPRTGVGRATRAGDAAGGEAEAGAGRSRDRPRRRADSFRRARSCRSGTSRR